MAKYLQRDALVLKITFTMQVSHKQIYHSFTQAQKILVELTTVHGSEAMLEDMWMAKHCRDRSRESTAVIKRVSS